MALRILLANPRGFCAGVNMAIDCVNRVLAAQGPPVYVYHEIVHNRHVVQDFRDRGVRFVDDLAAVPVGSTVVFSAHGVSPAIRRVAAARSLKVVDATCPLVTKVHHEVLRYARDGYHILFVGHREHQEAIGTTGEAPDAITVVETPQEAEALAFPPHTPLALVTQTTLSVSDAERVIRVLKRRYPNLRRPEKEDICYATTNRQVAVSELAAEADVVLVIGSRNSSNSNRLVDRATEAGVRGYLIDDATELDPTWLSGIDTVLVTAGASAPEHLVEALLDRLVREYDGSVETRTLVEEDVAFALPKSARNLAVLG